MIFSIYATISFVSKTIQFETFAFTYVCENVSRQFSISLRSISFIIIFFRFVSIRFFFRHCRVHFLFANIVKNILLFIDLSIESCQMFQKSKTIKYSWKCVIDVSFLFILFWKNIDFFEIIILKKLTCCLFCLFFRFFFINRWSIWKN